MYSVRVHTELSNRLDAEFYSPEALLAIHRIYSVGEVSTLGNEITEGYRVVYHGTDSVANLPNNKKLGFLSPTQISSEGDIDFDCIDELPLYYKDQYPKGLAKSGELLIEVKGNVSKVAVVPGKFPQNLMISGSLYKATLSDKVDPHYALAFLKSKQGQLLKNRLTSNTIINYIGKEDLFSIPVLLIAPFAQKYIGDKVRQAERLRAWAKRLLAISDQNISANFKYSLVDSMKDHPRWMPSKLVSDISLGPEFARGTEGQQTFKNAVSFIDVIDSCKCGDPIKSEDRVEGRFPYYGASGPIDFHNEYNFDGTNLIVAQDGSIGCASVARGKIWANNHVWIVKINDLYDVDTIARYLDIHFPYWKGITTGSVVPKVTAENLLRLKLPLDVAKDKYTGELLRTSGCASVVAKKLVAVARFLVEALIEGKLTEQQLIDAQKALESDDTSLDRDILGLLTTKGLDDEGDPLFTDLEQLYELLAQCQQIDE